MKTERWNSLDVDLAAERLKHGAVVAFPTDTVYGLGVCYDQEKALTALKQAKGRPEKKPIPLMIANLSQARQVADVSDRAWRIMEKWMPGALTVVLRKRPETPGRTGEAVLEQLDGAIDAIVMGTAKGTLASTIVDCSTADLRVLREGPINEQTLRKLWDENR